MVLVAPDDGTDAGFAGAELEWDWLVNVGTSMAGWSGGLVVLHVLDAAGAAAACELEVGTAGLGGGYMYGCCCCCLACAARDMVDACGRVRRGGVMCSVRSSSADDAGSEVGRASWKSREDRVLCEDGGDDSVLDSHPRVAWALPFLPLPMVCGGVCVCACAYVRS